MVWPFSRKAPARVPADLAASIATTGDGRDITRPYIQDLQQARDPKLGASPDWGVSPPSTPTS